MDTLICGKRRFTMVLGRFQVPHPHKGHVTVIDTLLAEGKDVVIALRKEDGSPSNPYSQAQRRVAFEGIYKKEIAEGLVVIINVPDIDEVAYGRAPGWAIREIIVPEEIAAISGMEVRKSSGYKIVWLTGNSGAGKTTIAKELLGPLNAVNLDGDEMRSSISLGAGFSHDERKVHNKRVARLAKVLSQQRNVVVSVIAPSDEIRGIVSEICNPVWVFIDRAMHDRENYPYEAPKNPDIYIINNPAHVAPQALAEGILYRLHRL